MRFSSMGFPQPARADYCGKPSIDPRPFGSTIRDSGHLAGTPAARWSGTEPAISRRHGCVEAVVKPVEEGAYVYQHLNRCSCWEGPRKKGQGFKPDLGNLAVRHYRGAAGNVSHGGTVNPSCNRKSRNGNPPPTAGRARVLSQRFKSGSVSASG